MLKVSIKIEDDKTKWNKFWSRVNKSGGHADVGLFGQDDSELPLIGAVQEYGNPDNRYYNTPQGAHAPIPSRPFLRHTYDKYLKEMEEFIDKQLEKYIKGKTTYNEVYEKTGQKFQKLVQKEMKDSSNWEENSPVTIEKKGSSKPLFDTGNMWAMITYYVNKRFEDIAVNF